MYLSTYTVCKINYKLSISDCNLKKDYHVLILFSTHITDTTDKFFTVYDRMCMYMQPSITMYEKTDGTAPGFSLFCDQT